MSLMDLFIKIGVDDQASKKVSGITGLLKKGFVGAAKLATAAITAASTAIMGIGTFAIQVGQTFEAQMDKVAAISGATGANFDALKKKAMQMGIETKFSATEAAQAFEYMAMAGWKTEDMLNGVEGIMMLAAASGEDLASVSDIVTDALTAFGLAASDSAHFSDVLAAASSGANTNVGMMGETFKYVAPVAGAMGFSIEDTAIAIGLMANAGIKGSQAGTSLRAILSRLASPTKEVEVAMAALGISITTASGEMRPLNAIIGDMRTAFAGLTEAQQIEMAATLGGQEAMSGLLAIVNASQEDFDALSATIYNADGASAQMAATMADNLTGQLTLLRSSAEGFGLAIYENLQVPLTDLAREGISALNSLTEAYTSGGISGLIAQAGDLLGQSVARIVEFAPTIIQAAVDAVNSFLTALSENQEAVANGTLQIVTTIINGIIGVFPQIIQLGLDVLLSFTSGIADNLGELVPTVIDVMLQIVNTLTDPATLANLLDAALAIIAELAKQIMNPDVFNQLMIAAASMVSNLATFIVMNLPQLLTTAVTLIGDFVKFVLSEENLKSLATLAGDILSTLAVGLTTASYELVLAVAGLVMTIIDTFKATDWKQLGQNLIDGFKAGVQNAWNNIVDWFKGLFGDIISIAKKILGIASPSKVFKQLGSFTAEGFGLGFDDEFAHVKDDVENAMNFDDMQIDANIHRSGAYGAVGGGNSYGDIIINIDGARYSNEQDLALAVAEALQNMTDRKAAVYA